MRPYLIEAPYYAHNCGGLKSLAKLCHMLNERGLEAYMSDPRVNPEFNTPTARTLSHEKLKDLQHNGIVVYPDITPDNPHNFTHCVRWWLGATQPPPPHQLVFAFQDMHQVIVKADHNLCIIHIEDAFKPPEIDNRHTTCCYGGKGQGGFQANPAPEVGTHDTAVPGCVRITGGFPPRREELLKLFQSSKVFYCYDNLTVMMAEARLCGTPVILMGHYTLSRESFDKDPFGMAMIGMYEDKPDLEVLKGQYPEFLEKYQARMDKTEKELDIFIEETQKWNPNNIYVENPGPFVSSYPEFRTR